MERLRAASIFACAVLAGQACVAGPEASGPEESAGDRADAVSACALEAAIVSAKANGDAGNVASNVLDNNLSTRWSRKGTGSQLTLKLTKASDVSGVSLAWYKGNERKATFVVGVSSNGSTFQQVFSGKSSGTT